MLKFGSFNFQLSPFNWLDPLKPFHVLG
jgi:hypothetical protein